MAQQFDVIIIGSGLAGLSAALHLSSTHRVAVLTKTLLGDGSSIWAQGGIAAVLGENDTFKSHVDDTLVAGAGLCDLSATQFSVEGAPEAIKWLQKLGLAFTQEQGQLHLTREGGHGDRRIAHVTDATGAAIQKTLVQRVCENQNIAVFEQHVLIDLITTGNEKKQNKKCLGATVLNQLTGQIIDFLSPYTVLATGGAGRVYLHTTNPETATGDGIAAAWRAGCRVANMEFIQFHPTSLYHPKANGFLITEAVRGEGGHLLLPASVGGKRFMSEHDPRLELAPRDIVARAIDFEIKKLGVEYVNLDISHKSADFIKIHFPNIKAKCLTLGIDICKDPIPVVPAAHYTCGGVMTDLQGKTDLDGLLAVGETTYTGLHGANRLASNSLLECMVFAKAAANLIKTNSEMHTKAQVTVAPMKDNRRNLEGDEFALIANHCLELRRIMSEYVGIVRSNRRLERAARRIQCFKEDFQSFYTNCSLSRELLEFRNLVQVSDLIVQSALQRRESRGLHFNRDFPALLEQAKPTILTPNS